MATAAYIFDAIRTPRTKGKSGGSLNEVKPVTLLTGLLNELRTRNDLDTSRVDDVVMGCVSPHLEQGANIAKTAVTAAGWDITVPGFQLNRFCASGLEAINLAAMKVASGWEHLVIAGGIESMSRVPIGSDGGAWMEDPETSIATSFVPQGIGADLIAALEGFSREDVDAFAMRSQQKAATAQKNGYFDNTVGPVRDINGLLISDKDEFIKPDTTMAGLAGLKPAFEALGKMGFDDVALGKYPQVGEIKHIHTAGNASGIVDGASAVIIANQETGQSLGLTPRARIVAAAVTSTDPTIMLTGPAPASRKALALANLSVDDIDLFEVNEAFAAVVLRFMKEMRVSEDKVNVNGGAIAMGHPLGATGGMIMGTLIDELERRQLKRGLATLCVGGGMGVATIIERL